MESLREIIAEAEARKVAIGHFNVSELAALRAVTKAARLIFRPPQTIPLSYDV